MLMSGAVKHEVTKLHLSNNALLKIA